MKTRSTWQGTRERARIDWHRIAFTAGGVLALEVGLTVGLIVKSALGG